ncbi:hypothetical protein [Inquilinus limosus]|uniref:DUF2214 domain-containing protein n=1 Tax=Inquilinus limosus TaxID=171674 RepID=A0A211ZJH7_9PROT|nr:hypothetical protein [Inquilinus limosus]OWJ65438.1 hypothetical protein BWR60_19355 [Inquilinus limosus]
MEHAPPGSGLLAETAALLEHSALGTLMRDSLWLYPAANLLHLLGLVLLAGGIGLLDLRLVGFGRSLPIDTVSRLLTRVALVGLALMVVTGAALFAADAGPLAAADIFQLKIVVIAAALANALAFRWVWRRSLADWDRTPPLLGRIQAAGSIVLWFLAGALGRLIAYG